MEYPDNKLTMLSLELRYLSVYDLVDDLGRSLILLYSAVKTLGLTLEWILIGIGVPVWYAL